MTKLFLIFSVLFCFSFSIYSQELEVEKPSSVVDYCEIVNNPEFYDGNIIKISGQYIAGFEISGLLSPDCKDKSILIYLDWGENYKSCGDLETDNTLKNRFKGIEDNNLEGIFVGKFVVKKGTSGFGHMNAKPYKLEVSCVEKVELLPKENAGCRRVDKTSPFHYLEYVTTEYGIKANYKIGSKKKKKTQIVRLRLVNNASCPIDVPIISDKTEILQDAGNALVVYKLDNRLVTRSSILVPTNQKESRFITDEKPVYSTLLPGNSITFDVPFQYFKKSWNISVPFKYTNKQLPENYEPFYFSWQELPKKNQ